MNEQRDCGNGQCICKRSNMVSYHLFAGHSRRKPVTAIANYTVRVVEKSLSAEQTMEALLFLGELALSVCVGARALIVYSRSRTPSLQLIYWRG